MCSDAAAPHPWLTSGGSAIPCPCLAPAVTHTVGLDAERAAGIVPEGHPDALAHFSLDHRSWKSVHGLITGYFYQTVYRSPQTYGIQWPAVFTLARGVLLGLCCHRPGPWHMA